MVGGCSGRKNKRSGPVDLNAGTHTSASVKGGGRGVRGRAAAAWVGVIARRLFGS